MGKHSARKSNHKLWQAHIESWSKSGLTQSEYCRQRQLSRDAFTYWKRRLHPEQKAEPANNLVPLPFRLPAQDRSKLPVPLKLVVGDRFGLEISADFDSALLEKILLTLGRLS
jgi:hypothetical protein